MIPPRAIRHLYRLGAALLAGTFGHQAAGEGYSLSLILLVVLASYALAWVLLSLHRDFTRQDAQEA